MVIIRWLIGEHYSKPLVEVWCRCFYLLNAVNIIQIVITPKIDSRVILQCHTANNATLCFVLQLYRVDISTLFYPNINMTIF